MNDLDLVVRVATGVVTDDDLLDHLGNVATGAVDDDALYETLAGLYERGVLVAWLAECFASGVSENASQTPLSHGREQYAMVPKSVIESGLDDYCKALFVFIDLEQGDRFKAPEGLQAMADRIGWQARTVLTHAEHLAAFGIVELHREGKRRVVVRMVGNMARLNRERDSLPLPGVVKKSRPPSHRERRDTRSTHVSSDDDKPSPDTRETHVVTRVQRVRDTRSTRDRYSVPSASEEEVCEELVTRELRELRPDEPWPEDEVLERLLLAFPGAVVEAAA